MPAFLFNFKTYQLRLLGPNDKYYCDFKKKKFFTERMLKYLQTEICHKSIFTQQIMLNQILRLLPNESLGFKTLNSLKSLPIKTRFQAINLTEILTETILVIQTTYLTNIFSETLLLQCCCLFWFSKILSNYLCLVKMF